KQVITVVDTTAPVITCPANMTLECPADTGTNKTGVASATDTCSAVNISYSDLRTNGCGTTYGIVRTWTATDTCGNSSSCNQVIKVVDTTPSSITCPGNVTVQCASQVPPPNPASVTTSDSCGGPVTVIFAGDATNNQTCPNRY